MSESLKLGRRDLLRHMLVLAGASATTGFTLEALADAAQSPDKFLSKSAFNTLSAVADTIIPVTDTPGALAANVPASLDALLSNWAAPSTREMIVGALARIDQAAQAARGKPFASLASDERTTFLIEHEKAALRPVPPPANAGKGPVYARHSSVADDGYYSLKNLVVTLYYASEIGLTQELVYEHVPGAWVPSLKITPDTRPFADANIR